MLCLFFLDFINRCLVVWIVCLVSLLDWGYLGLEVLWLKFYCRVKFLNL